MPTISSAGARSRQPGQTSREIVRTALHLFSTYGYEGTTMRQIAAQVGVKPASLYNHYPSKQAILEDICRQAMDELLAGERAALAGGMETREDVIEAVRAFVTMHTEFHIRERRASRIINQQLGSLDEPGRTRAFEMRDSYEHGLRRAIERGVELGVFHVPDARLASYAILATGMHLSVWFHEGGRLTPREIVAHHVALAFQTLGADPERLD